MVRLSILAFLVVLSVTSCTASTSYRMAVEPQRGSIVTAVRDYYALRNHLTAGLDINDFWQTYPELSYDHDLVRGTNLEVMLWKWSHDPQLVRLDTGPRSSHTSRSGCSFARTTPSHTSTAWKRGTTPAADRRRQESSGPC